MSAWFNQALSVVAIPPTTASGDWSPAWLLVGFFALLAGTIAMAWRQAQATYKQQLTQFGQTSRKDKEDRQRLEQALNERKAAKEALQAVKQQLEGHKKKHHQLQLTWKQEQLELQKQLEKAKELAKSRPALLETELRLARRDQAPQPERARPQAAEAEAKSAVQQPAPAAQSPMPPVPKDPSLEALKAELATLQRQQQQQLAEHEQQQRLLVEQLQETKEALRRLRRKSEDSRKLEFVSKAQNQVLTDKLKHLAKQYYDAISELAVLKGEVQPPRPKEIGTNVASPKASASPAKPAQPVSSAAEEEPFRPAVIVRLPTPTKGPEETTQPEVRD